MNDITAPETARIISVHVPPKQRLILDAKRSRVRSMFIMKAIRSFSPLANHAPQSAIISANAPIGAKNSDTGILAVLTKYKAKAFIASVSFNHISDNAPARYNCHSSRQIIDVTMTSAIHQPRNTASAIS